MKKSNLAWNFLFQYGYVITNILISILLMPIYVAKINLTTLGIWLTISNLLSWLTIADPGIAEVLQQKIAQLYGEKNETEISKTIGSGIIGSISIFIFVVIFGLIFTVVSRIFLNVNFEQFPQLENSIYLTVLSTALTLAAYGFAGINLGLFKAKIVAVSFIFSNIFFLLINQTLLKYDLGIISIGISNFLRAFLVLLINIYGIFILNKSKIIFEKNHFKNFVKIFSFTSVSKVFSTIASNFDLIILAKVMPQGMITIFEINRRPMKLTQGLAGRYSIALMPYFSNLLGMSQYEEISEKIKFHLKIFLTISVIISAYFYANFEQIMTIWIGKNLVLDKEMILLILANFIFSMVGYFMSNIAYALNDIKKNSLLNIIKNTLLIISMIIGAFIAQSKGLLIATLFTTIFFDAFVFTKRLYNLKYIKLDFLKSMLFFTPKLLLIVLIYDFLMKFSKNLGTISNSITWLLANFTILVLLAFCVMTIGDKDLRIYFKTIFKYKIK